MVYATGEVRPSLLTICPCADPVVLHDNSLGEELFLAGEDLQDYDGTRVELIGLRVDCGDCVKIDVYDVKFQVPQFYYGDVNGDFQANPVDVVLTINYLLLGGDPVPNGWRSVDLNFDGKTNLADLVRLINLVYRPLSTVTIGVWGSFPCADTAGPYPGCRYSILKNSVPFDTGTVDGAGILFAALPPDVYQVALFPPESSLPPVISVDLTAGDVVWPTLALIREYIDSLLLLEVNLGVTQTRVDSIIGYLGGYVVTYTPGGSFDSYEVALPNGMHFEQAMEILSNFPEIQNSQPVPIPCP